MRHRGNEHQQGVPPRPPHGTDLMSLGVALPQRPRLQLLLTDDRRCTRMLNWGRMSGLPAARPATERPRPCAAWPGRRRRGALLPPNNALKLTGHCYDLERFLSPAA